MAVIKKLAISLLVLISVILIYALFRPNTYYIKRSMSMNAAPEKIFNYLNDPKSWNLWFTMPKDLETSYSGPATGKGATFIYKGKSFASGSGKSIIVESIKRSKVAIDLNMTKPFGSFHTIEYTIEAENNHTVVTWLMIHRNNYIAKLIHIFIDIDDFIGPLIERDLLKLKHLVEK